LKIKCIKDGKLNVALRGVDFRDDYDNRLPIYVKYTKLMIDEEDVIKQPDLFGITNISLMIWTGKMVKQLILLSNGVLSKGEI